MPAKKPKPEAVPPVSQGEDIPSLPNADVESGGGPKDSDLKNLVNLARLQYALQQEETRLLKELAEVQQKLKANMEVDLPLVMDEIGVKAIPLSNGAVVEMQQATRASITEANKPAAHAWLIAHKMEDLIKREIKITFGRDEVAWAKKFMADMAKRKKPLNYKAKEFVDTNTLSAQVRRMRADFEEAGKNPDDAIPKDLFGVYIARSAVVKVPVDGVAVKSKAKAK